MGMLVVVLELEHEFHPRYWGVCIYLDLDGFPDRLLVLSLSPIDVA